MIDVDGYLAVLGVDRPKAPDAEALSALHRAHVERVPYENLDIHLGRPTGIGAAECVDRIVRGRGGYCFHLNGAFAALLTALGYEVTLHRAGVQGTLADPPNVGGEHLGLTVRLDGERWLVDVALAGGLYEPVPLREGPYVQAPFTVALAPSEVAPGGWRFLHDGRAPFTAIDFAPQPVELASFAEKHEHLSTSPESGFVRVLTAQLRDAKGLFVLRSRLLRRIDAAGTEERIIDSPEEFEDVLAEVFRIDLTDIAPAGRSDLWRRACDQHRTWEATR
ncbi:arylamine N-acetyltransferase family protein [Streptomyces sp. NRRL WC-3742]|uniref:arylamine N-acetyltransferase family protein n=1 Tax=Streptomyces sp. NRRL WC-3742 TaxID=1463934 RepID=UPI00068DEBE7|nr:arylamine N-acetyltransferase [Streptomyces sp. NRRL WC-3742]